MVEVSGMSEFVAEWGPRIGEEASRLQVRGTRLLLAGVAAATGWIVAQVLGSDLHSGAVLVAAGLLLLAALGLLAAGTLIMGRSRRSMSAFLGVEVPFMEAPRLHPETFRRWCQHHGVGDARR